MTEKLQTMLENFKNRSDISTISKFIEKQNKAGYKKEKKLEVPD